MSAKKTVRSDNTYIISTDETDNPKLGAKILENGKESLFLLYYLGYTIEHNDATNKDVIKKDRKREALKLYLWQAPRNAQERQHNKETLELAKQIRIDKSREFLANTEGYKFKKDRKINFLTYFQNYIDNYTKKDIRMLTMALNRFKDFLAATPEYKKYATNIRPEQLTKDMMIAFSEYLQSRSKGEGAKSCFQRFKKVINYAVDHDVIIKNPCKDITIKVDDQILRKDILSEDEIKQLIATHDPKQNNEVRRAFIFSLYCGLRYCDVKDLTYSNIDYSHKLLKFEQNKTKGHSANSGVVIPLPEGLMNFIGKPSEGEDNNSLLFKLPSYTMCIKSVQRWVTHAGINKHITWHCARHSFAVNILNNGANIKTVASLLGHSGLKHTEKYTRAVDSLKTDAMNSLAALNLNE